MPSVDLSVTIVDPALDPGAAMWGDARDGWVEDAFEWLGTLAAAGVPLRALRDPGEDDGRGLLLVPRPETAPESLDRAEAGGRPVLTGPAPPTASERLAAVRNALGALVRPTCGRRSSCASTTPVPRCAATCARGATTR